MADAVINSYYENIGKTKPVEEVIIPLEERKKY